MAFITITRLTRGEANAIRDSRDLASFTEMTETTAKFHKNDPANLLARIDGEIGRLSARGRPCEPLQSVRRKVEDQIP